MTKKLKPSAVLELPNGSRAGNIWKSNTHAAKDGERSKGYGGELFDWIVEYARGENCDQIKLVSHVKRFAAHRFYLNKRMIVEAHYFRFR